MRKVGKPLQTNERRMQPRTPRHECDTSYLVGFADRRRAAPCGAIKLETAVMALTYELGDIEDWKKKCLNKDGLVNGQVEAVIFLTMLIGMNKITTENVKDFTSRVRLYERLFDPITSSGEPTNTLIEFESLIGLTTNASPMSDAAFWKQIRRTWTEREARNTLF